MKTATRVKMLKGYHLTAVDKRGLLALFNSGLTEGKIKRKTFTLLPSTVSDIWQATIAMVESNDYGGKSNRISNYTITFS